MGMLGLCWGALNVRISKDRPEMDLLKSTPASVALEAWARVQALIRA